MLSLLIVLLLFSSIIIFDAGLPTAPAIKFVRAFLEVGGSLYSLDLVMLSDTPSTTKQAYHVAGIYLHNTMHSRRRRRIC